MITSQRQTLTERPWLDPEAKPQIVIDRVAKTYGSIAAVNDVSLSIFKGEMFALVGASGCGKTTLLRMLAGFVTPTRGQILIDGIDMTDVPPYERPVNMMFQSYALFPHMTVEDNVGYGLRRLKLTQALRKQRVHEALEMVQLASLGQRKPHQLSGGQRQRVALARALIRRPKVLLLDEPLSALDKKLRESTQFELMDLQYQLGITFVVVTHDQDEAMTLASRIAVMNQGALLQMDTPAQVYEYPNSRFVADFFGAANLIEGKITHAGSGLVTLQTDALPTPLIVRDEQAVTVGETAWVAIRPEKIRLSKAPIVANNAAINQLTGVVWELGYLGNRSTYQIKTASGTKLSAAAQNERRTVDWRIDWNDEVVMSWDPADAVLLRR